MVTRVLYFPAVNQAEAAGIVGDGSRWGWATRAEANQHLAEIKREADPFYGTKYRVYAVQVVSGGPS